MPDCLLFAAAKPYVETLILPFPAGKMPERSGREGVSPDLKIRRKNTVFLILTFNRIIRHPTAAAFWRYGIKMIKNFVRTDAVLPNCISKTNIRRNIHDTFLLSSKLYSVPSNYESIFKSKLPVLYIMRLEKQTQPKGKTRRPKTKKKGGGQ